MGLIGSVRDKAEGMKVYKKFLNESKEAHAVVTYIGDGKESPQLKAAVDSWLEGTKKKSVVIASYQRDDGSDETMMYAVFEADKSRYYKGGDIVVKYIEYNGRYYALPADDEMFSETDRVAKQWNKGLFRTVITVLKYALRGM